MLLKQSQMKVNIFFSIFILSFVLLYLFLMVSFSFIGPLVPGKRAGEVPHSEEAYAIRQKVDVGITSQHSVSFDFINSVSRFLAGPNHNFHEVTFSLSFTLISSTVLVGS